LTEPSGAMLMRATSKTLREPRPYPVRGNTGWTVDKGTSTGTGTGGRAGGSVDAVATREPDSAGRAATADGVDAAAPIAGAATAVRTGAGVATTEATGVLPPAVAAPGYAGAAPAVACPPGEGAVPLAAASAGTGPAASDGAANEGPDAVGAGVTPGAAPAAEARLLARPGAGTLATKGGVMIPADARTGGGAAGRAGAGTAPEAASFAPTRTPVAVLRSGVGLEVGVGTSIGVGAGRAAGAGAGAGKLVEAFVNVAAAVVAGTAATRAAGACA
jgi:hypothetical protein